MKKILACIALSILAACASKPQVNYAPVAATIQSADTKLASVEKLSPVISEARKDLQEATTQAKKASENQAHFESWADLQIKSLKAKNSSLQTDLDTIAGRWHRIAVALLFVGPFVFWGAEWAAKSSPYTMWLPGIIPGFAGLFIVCLFAYVVFSVWSAFGWIAHLF